MSTITHVPLPPIAKGALAKLWLGLFVLVLGGIVVAGVAKPTLVAVTTLKAGTGPNPAPEDYAMLQLTGRLGNGTIFQPPVRTMVPVNKVVPGFTKALLQMQAGGKYEVYIPASLGYGARSVGPIPANSDLDFTIELINFETPADFEQQQMMMEQMRRMRARGGGRGPQGAPSQP